MEMRDWENLKEEVCGELEKITHRRGSVREEIHNIHKYTDTIKNIDKILTLEGQAAAEGYSRYGGDYADGGNSYRRGHYVRGHYSMDGQGGSYGHGGGYSRRGGYSRAEGNEEMVKKLKHVLKDGSVSSEVKNTIMEAINEMEG